LAHYCDGNPWIQSGTKFAEARRLGQQPGRPRYPEQKRLRRPTSQLRVYRDHTVKHHVKAVIDKLEAADRTEAVARAFELGLLG